MAWLVWLRITPPVHPLFASTYGAGNKDKQEDRGKWKWPRHTRRRAATRLISPRRKEVFRGKKAQPPASSPNRSTAPPPPRLWQRRRHHHPRRQGDEEERRYRSETCIYVYIYIYIEVRARRQVQSSTACRAARIVRCQPSICEFHPRGNPPSPPHRARTGGLPGHVSYLVSCSRLRGTLERKRTRPYRARTHHVIWNCEQRLTPPFLFPIFYFSNFRRRRNNFYFHIFDSVWFFFFVSGYFFLSFFSSRETMWRVSSKIDQLLEFRGWRWTTGEIGWNFKQDCADWMIKI